MRVSKLKNSSLSIVFFITLLISVRECHAQVTLFYDYYNSGNGLSQNSVYSIAQTSDGFMWFGTQEGINRFDGKYFAPVSENYDKNNPHEMDYGEFSKTINALYQGKQDRLWVGTAKELSIYNRFTNKFYTPQTVYPHFSIPAEANINAITETGNLIWILTQNKGIFAYDLQSQQMQSFTWKQDAPKKIISLQQDQLQNIWLCSEKEIFKLSGQVFVPQEKANALLKTTGIICMKTVGRNLWLITGKREIMYFGITVDGLLTMKDFWKEFSGKDRLKDPNTLHLSSDSILWIGSRSEGLIKVNLNRKTFESTKNNSNKQYSNTNFVLSFFTDRQKITWVGLSGGIFKFDIKDTRIDRWKAESSNLNLPPDNHIMSIYSQNNTDIYMGTLNAGLLHLDRRTMKPVYYMPTNIGNTLSEASNIYEVTGGQDNLLWMATWGGLYSFNTLTKQFVEYKDFNDEQTLQLCALVKLKNSDKLLVGGYNGGLRLFSTTTKHFSPVPDFNHFLDSNKLRVRYMKEMSGGNVLMSTEANCLINYNYLSGEFTPFPQFKNLCGASRYFCFHDRFLWIATDDGLIQADKNTMRVVRFWTVSNGLKNDYIYTVMPDQFDRIWVSTNGGLSMIEYKNGTCRNFGLSDNLQDLEFNTASCYKDHENKLWFGGINGLNIVEPNISKPDRFSPAPALTGIQVMNQPLVSDTATPYLKQITLPYNQNFISFQFQTLNFAQTDKIIYKYLMEGVDTGWISSANQQIVNYTQLQPGNYKFRIKSANAGDIWSATEATLQITITPPWWKTWWFKLGSSLAAVLLLISVIAGRIKTIRKQESLKYKIIETEMKSLRAQMNPHFIFNSLNSINGFIIENKTHLASDYLTKFSRLIRLILENSKNETIALEKEIETLKLYLLMESLRFENKFEYTIQVDDDVETEDIAIPPLMIQPYVENAIWHGLLPKTTKGRVLIRISKQADTLIIKIEDDGIGRKNALINKKIRPEKNKSYGMEITGQRILALDANNKIHIEDLTAKNGEPQGTLVTLKLHLPLTT